MPRAFKPCSLETNSNGGFKQEMWNLARRVAVRAARQRESTDCYINHEITD